MYKLFSIILLLLCTSFMQVSYAAKTQNTDYNTVKESDFDFNNNTYEITDEQLEKSQTKQNKEEKTSFDSKVINSSHFTAGTATKTYIPLNKLNK